MLLAEDALPGRFCVEICIVAISVAVHRSPVEEADEVFSRSAFLRWHAFPPQDRDQSTL